MNDFQTLSSPRGTRRPFPKHRQTILDLLQASQKIPSFPLIRKMNLSEVVRARQTSSLKVGWTTLFGKAYAIVSEELPELRELFVRYPHKHLYYHPHSVASMSIHRRDEQGQYRLIWGRWNKPESTSLVQLQHQLDFMCTAPLDEAFRAGMILERRSAPIRRFAFWWAMNCSGRNRAKYIGTFSISSLGGQGALNAHHPLITPSSLAFGPITSKGECEVVLICDHRTLDGILGAQALELLESVLRNQIAEELTLPSSVSAVA